MNRFFEFNMRNRCAQSLERGGEVDQRFLEIEHDQQIGIVDALAQELFILVDLAIDHPQAMKIDLADKKERL